MAKVLFCEECGSPVEAGSRFCENCGFKLNYEATEAPQSTEVQQTTRPQQSTTTQTTTRPPQSTATQTTTPPPQNTDTQQTAAERGRNTTKSQMELFRDKKWKDAWKSAVSKHGNENVGLLILNDAAWFDDKKLYKVLADFVSSRRDSGVYYFPADMTCDVWRRTKDALSVLKDVCSVARPKFCLLLGDNTTIPSAKWKNPSYSEYGDGDKYVDSDLMYVTLDTHEPHAGQKWAKFDFGGGIRVGRVPCCAEDNRAGAVEYFRQVCESGTLTDKPATYALSADCWSAATKVVAGKLTDSIYLSPPVSPAEFGTSTSDKSMYDKYKKSNMLLFNLHGSLQSVNWMGQRGSSYPTAFSPECLPKKNKYVIGVEACYGAKPNQSNSTLCTSMKNGCLSFFGSRQIAYGSPNKNISCADIVTCRFMEDISKGKCAGDAYISSLTALTSQGDMDDTELKTLAEFALYGDPSLCVFRSSGSTGHSIFSKSADRSTKKFGRSIEIPMPDVRRAVSLKLAEVKAAIETKVQHFVEQNHSEFEGCRPNIFEVSGINLYQAIYSKKTEGPDQLMKVYFDKSGNVKRVYQSK